MGQLQLPWVTVHIMKDLDLGPTSPQVAGLLSLHIAWQKSDLFWKVENSCVSVSGMHDDVGKMAYRPVRKQLLAIQRLPPDATKPVSTVYIYPWLPIEPPEKCMVTNNCPCYITTARCRSDPTTPEGNGT